MLKCLNVLENLLSLHCFVTNASTGRVRAVSSGFGRNAVVPLCLEFKAKSGLFLVFGHCG